MNMYLRELNRNKKGLIIWSLITIAYIAMVMAMYPMMIEQSQSYTQMIEEMPKSFTSVFGLDEVPITELFGYYSGYGYYFIILLGGIYAMILGAGILSKEEGDKTIEFLLAKPVTRHEIVTSKLLSALTNLIIFNIVITVAAFISLKAISEEAFSMKIFLLLSVAPLLLEITFLSLGFLVSVFITKSRKVLPFSLGIVLMTYFIGTVSEIVDKFQWLMYLSPFKYVDGADIIKNEAIAGKFLAIMLILSTLFIILTYSFYRRKDITL